MPFLVVVFGNFGDGGSPDLWKSHKDLPAAVIPFGIVEGKLFVLLTPRRADMTVGVVIRRENVQASAIAAHLPHLLG